MERPLVLVIRLDGHFTDLLRKSGCEVLNIELIRTEPVDDLGELVEAIKRVDQYDGIFFTSPVAAEIFLRQFKIEGRTYPGKVYVFGERAKAVLAGSGLNLVTDKTANTAQDLIEAFDETELTGKKFLFIRGDRSVRTIPEMLGDVAQIDELVVYRTCESEPGDDRVNIVRDRFKKEEVDWVCFFSPSGVESFMNIFGGENLAIVRGAAIGETTARRAREFGIRVEFISPRSNAEDFGTGLAAYIKSIE